MDPPGSAPGSLRIPVTTTELDPEAAQRLAQSEIDRINRQAYRFRQATYSATRSRLDALLSPPVEDDDYGWWDDF